MLLYSDSYAKTGGLLLLCVQVAQLWTIWRQRQIKAGIDARTSRKQLKAQVGNMASFVLP